MNTIKVPLFAAILLISCGCSKQKEIDTSPLYSETEWERSVAHDKSVLQLPPTEKRYQMERRQFLYAQLAKALLERGIQSTPALKLGEVELKALREMIDLDNALATTPENIDWSTLEVGIDKRNDGRLNVVLTKAGSRHIRSTAATWVQTGK